MPYFFLVEILPCLTRSYSIRVHSHGLGQFWMSTWLTIFDESTWKSGKLIRGKLFQINTALLYHFEDIYRGRVRAILTTYASAYWLLFWNSPLCKQYLKQYIEFLFLFFTPRLIWNSRFVVDCGPFLGRGFRGWMRQRSKEEGRGIDRSFSTDVISLRATFICL